MQMITITICAGTTCVVMGGSHLLILEDLLPDHLRDRVEVKGGRCLDFCHQERSDEAPYVLVDGELLAEASLTRIVERLETLVHQQDKVEGKGGCCLDFCDEERSDDAPYVLIDGELLVDASRTRTHERLETLVGGSLE